MPVPPSQSHAVTGPESSLVDVIEARNIRAFKKNSVSVPEQNLAQLYRFCFLMLGDAGKAQEIFHATLRDAALRAAEGTLPNERFWLFRDVRWRCLEASKADLQAEPLEIEEHEVTAEAASQIERLEPI